MFDIVVLFSRVLLLVLLMLPTALMKKFGLVKDGFGVSLSNYVLYVGTPGMIILALYRDFDKTIALRSLAVVGFFLVFHLVFFAVSLLFFRVKKHDPESGEDPEEAKRRRALRFGTIFTNAGYMGLPLVLGLLGSEAAIYVSVYVVCFNILVWTVGCYVFTGDVKYMSLKKAFLNPASIAIMVGLIFFITPINNYLPPVSEEFFSILNSLVAPLSMGVIGLHLFEINWTKIWRDLVLYRYLFVRMLLLPTLLFCILKLAKIIGYYDEIVFNTLFICGSTPCAAVTVMYAERFDGDAPYASTMVCVSTLLAVGTMPLVALLLYLL